MSSVGNQYGDQYDEISIRPPVVDDQPQGISEMVRNAMSSTFRNTVNNFARDARANTNIHYASKFAVVGVFASVVGVVESVARIVYTVAVSFFNSISDDDGMDGLEPEEEVIVGNSLNLIGYHSTNIATLGLFGLSIRDKASEKELIERYGFIRLNKGDAYGLVDIKD